MHPSRTPSLRILIRFLQKAWKIITFALPLSQHSITSFEKVLLLTTHCLSIVSEVLKKASQKHEKSFISGHESPLLRSSAAPGPARICPDLPGRASTRSWDPRYTPSRAHVSIRHQAARPPAGVSNYGSNLGRFSPHCMQIACNSKGLSSSREAPKPHFPSFATLPSENLDFHEKSYFYQRRSGSRSPWIPILWGP